MKKNDFIWGAILVLFVAFVSLEPTHSQFISLTTAHPYLGGFFKFALLATMGEMLVTRLNQGQYKKADGFIYRVIIWGLLGMVITLIFQIFAAGTSAALEKGYLIGKGSTFAFAFFTSCLMNLTFAPTMMAFHRYTDTYIDLKFSEGISQPTSSQVIDKIDWKGFISFVLFKTIPFFWIPAHTLTFLLPGEYRVLAAAFLSMALGLLLTIGKRKK
ncbi:hypothetical protein [Fusibacter ferrireducens]|uniref:Mpv17/PMP22 family protein n=1 Tax=Fusibacter ferrireducens TaxID=2785058 RepID=A0ABR9ZYW3_9FIRM|nr:hypothetical protein [Fusibacter ferrireducens]MBF4695653.1 hypothetical protein [Fusibacter ferrireducens]